MESTWYPVGNISNINRYWPVLAFEIDVLIKCQKWFFSLPVQSIGRAIVVTSVVCIHITVPITLRLKFYVQVFQKVISWQPLIRKHSYLEYRYPGGSAFIPQLLTPVSMPWGGARGKKLGTFKKCFSAFLLCKQFMKIVGQTSLDLMTLTCV